MPAINPKSSDKKSDTDDGNLKGGGSKGGGQGAKQSGTGSPGSHSPSEQGNAQSTEQGAGDTGSKAGDQTKSDRPTGRHSSESGHTSDGPGTKDGREPGGDGEKSAGAGGSKPGQQTASHAANPLFGGQPGTVELPVDSQPSAAPAGDDPNLEYARKATALALEHLADQTAKDHSKLLDRLGWTRKEAEDFIRQWETMRKAAGQTGPEGKTAKAELDEALRSLGLRPRGTELKSDRSQVDKLQHLKDAGHFAPPPEMIEQFRAYTQGVAGSGK
jgi:hypothetical protein